MFIALAGVGIDDGEGGVEVGSCVCYLRGEVGQVMVDDDVGLAGPGLGVVWLYCGVGSWRPRLRKWVRHEAGRRFFQDILVRPGWMVMLAERNAARSAASF
jgi:hypothetical protein